MIFYLTFGDAFSGIYKSQVIDAVSFLKARFDIKIRLVAFISIRLYRCNRKTIKKYLPDAVVLPMFPKMENWKKNIFLLKIAGFMLSPNRIIARGTVAALLALKYKNKKRIPVIYDCRGAVAAEWNEYNVVESPFLRKMIAQLDREAVLRSDFRMAVSGKLVDYWRNTFGYKESEHVVIPCTVDDSFLNVEITEESINAARQKMGFNSGNIILIYSGSTAGWQSFNILTDYIQSVFEKQEHCVLFFLGKETEEIKKLKEQYPERVKSKSVSPEEVRNYLTGADYGLLIRENSITNQVASPVKFAEYLACGLRIIISEDLGDYSQFTLEYDCGFIFNKQDIVATVSLNQKEQIKTLASKFFSKESNTSSYKKILSHQ